MVEYWQPQCYNTVMVVGVTEESGGRSKLRHEKFEEDAAVPGTGVRCPERLMQWLIPRGGGGGGGGEGVEWRGSTRRRRRGKEGRERRRRGRKSAMRMGVDGRLRPPKGESGKRLNYYELEIGQIHYQVYPTSGTITVTGIPSPDCVPVMLEELCSTTGLLPEEIDRCEPVNATYSGQLTPLQCGIALDNRSFGSYLRDGLEEACRQEGLFCSYRNSQFSGVHIKSFQPEEVRGSLTLFKSGKYNILGVRSGQEAEEWHRRVCAVIRRCWTTSGRVTPSVWNAASFSSPASASAVARREAAVRVDLGYLDELELMDVLGGGGVGGGGGGGMMGCL